MNQLSTEERDKKKTLLKMVKNIHENHISPTEVSLSLSPKDQKRLQMPSFLTNAKFFSLIQNIIMKYETEASDAYFQYIFFDVHSVNSLEQEKVMKEEVYEACKEIKNISPADRAFMEALEKAIKKAHEWKMPFEEHKQKSLLEYLPLMEMAPEIEQTWRESGIIQDLKLYTTLQDYIVRIQNTEQFYGLRDIIKESVNHDKEIRNELIETLIAGNPMLETVYDWTKFQRIIGKTERRWWEETKKMEAVLPPDVIASFTIDKIPTLLEALQSSTDLDEKCFFEMQKNVNAYFHPFGSVYHFVGTIANAESEQDLPIDLLYYYLTCLNIKGEDLIQAAGMYEKSCQTNLSILTLLSQGENSLYAQRVLEILQKMMGCCETKAIPTKVDEFARSCRLGGEMPKEEDPSAYGIIKDLPVQMKLKKL